MNLKKRLIPLIPYFFIGLYASKIGQARRLTEGADLSAKLMNITSGFGLAFQSPLPSFHPADLCIGLLLGALLRLAVYMKGKNAKKYRKNMEYGSARWGTAEDIRPYMDPVFENNVILTQTERLMMAIARKILRMPATKTCWSSAALAAARQGFLLSLVRP